MTDDLEPTERCENCGLRFHDAELEECTGCGMLTCDRCDEVHECEGEEFEDEDD